MFPMATSDLVRNPGYRFYEGPLTVAAMNRKLGEYQTHYNTCRPHDGIGLLTPMEYYQQLTQTA